MSEKLFSVYAVNIKTGERRLMDKDKTERNAEAFIKMAVIRRGVEEEFYVKAPQP
jgi:hypothetical protein